jgi:hypothetical protein
VRSIFEVVLEFFRTDGWPVTEVPGQTVATTSFRSDARSYAALAAVDEVSGTISFATLFPTPVPPPLRPVVTEFVARANFGLPLGCFTMDPDTGEVRFRTSADVDGGPVPVELVRNLVYTNCLAMDAYAPGLIRVLSGEATPEAAVADVEEPRP